MDSQKQFVQQSLYRILDANLDRAREGVRIVEEWCRFALENELLTTECKALRQELAGWHGTELRAARDTAGDVGTGLTHPAEANRTDVPQVLQANLCRVQEALRVLEEYGKVYRPEMALACKQMRYRVYVLESKLMHYSQFQESAQRHQTLQQARLYLVTSPSEKLFVQVEAALQGGLTLVQYRDKDTDDLLRLEQAQQLSQLCHQYGALFIVNDRVDLALAVDADGVHLGQQDMPFALARQLLGAQRIIGRSTKNPEEMQQAIQEGADYIGVGPVYETPTKAGRAAVGLDYVRYAVEQATIPWFAIGGIDTSNVLDVLNAGATRIAVVRAIMQAEHPTAITQAFLQQLSSLTGELGVAE
jgi:thiamine-phosphate pyrophosphorylase